jgi:glucose/arabinose dehydrogenase
VTLPITVHTGAGPRRRRPRTSSGTARLAAALTVTLTVTLTVAGCSGGSASPAPPATSAPSVAPSAAPSTSGPAAEPAGDPALPAVDADVATGLEVPWGVAFAADGSALVAQRKSGDVVRVRAGRPPVTVGRVPDVADDGEGGLLGLAFAPGDEKTLYAYLTTRTDNRIVTLSYDATAAAGRGLGAPTVIFSGLTKAGRHNGGRIVFGPDGALYAGVGDAGDTSTSQDLGSNNGKILRLNADGSVPADNPFPGSPVWSSGHRNVQGLAFDSAGRLWATEFGQSTWDELNLIEKGADYGWPTVEGKEGRAGYVDPQAVWPTKQASPSGLAIVDDVAYIGALRGARVWVVPLAGGAAGTPVAALTGRLGRIRTVAAAPDGSLWLTTSNRDGRGDPKRGDDRVVRATLSTG